MRRIAAAVAVLGASLIAWRVAVSCGPFIPEAQFHEEKNWISGEQLLRSGIGIVHPRLDRKSLITAYRYLTNEPLTPAEVRALYPEELPPWTPEPVDAAMHKWLEARRKISGLTDRLIDTYPIYQRNGSTFRNCLANAFLNASSTLDRRIAQWGASDAKTAEWVSGQDQVFAGCDGKGGIPAELAAQDDATLAADRRYQIAAAEFYTQRFADALRDFDTIAGDAGSEWRTIAPYLAARVLIRQASLENRPELLAEARRRLDVVIANPDLAAWHGPAAALLELIQVRQDPRAYLNEAAAKISHPGLEEGILPAVNDFSLVLDHSKSFPANSGLADWIRTFEGPDEEAHALARWRETHSPPWLIAALRYASNGDPDTPELIAAAAAVKPREPVYPTAAYLGIQLEMARNPDAARQWADAALASHQPPAVENDFLSERLELARNWTEFLRYAPRTPIAESSDVSDIPLEPGHDRKLFDSDAAFTFNGKAPLRRVVEAAHSPLLPRNLQLEVTRAGWTRAALLDSPKAAKDLAAWLSQLEPNLATDLKQYLSADGAASARFAAVFVMLRNPGLSPFVRDGFRRPTPLKKIDKYRDNWWRIEPADSASTPTEVVRAQLKQVTCLSAAELAQGRAEFAKLRQTAGIAPNYLSATVIGWVRAHPGDARNAEALALAVRSTRYQQTDRETTAWSKKAFLLLHSQYPKSEWAQRTKYWY
jgi:hypothetical protein